MDRYQEFHEEKMTKNGNNVRNQGELNRVAGIIS